jgi:uncharacterized membrane protein
VYSKGLDRVAQFAALALFLSIVELVIPKPIPFFRIGLANLPLLVALTMFPRRDFILLILLKIFGQGIVSGTLFSYVFLFSAAGSISSGVVMLLLRRWYPTRISLVGIGVFGAFASNIAQLLFAATFIFGRSTWLIAPLFLLVGTITGTVLGALAGQLLQHSRWLAATPGSATGGPHRQAAPSPGEPPSAVVSPVVRLVSGLLMVPPFLMQSLVPFKFFHIVLFGAASVYLGKRVRILPGVFIVAAVTGAQLLTPLGEVLTYIGAFPITAGALEQGLVRGLNLVGLVYLSRYAVSSGLPIPGQVGALLYRVFFYFEELTAYRVVRDRRAGFRQNIKRALIDIDEFLLQLVAGGYSGETAAGTVGGRRSGPRGRIVVPLAAVALQWGLVAAGRLPGLVSLLHW